MAENADDSITNATYSRYFRTFAFIVIVLGIVVAAYYIFDLFAVIKTVNADLIKVYLVFLLICIISGFIDVQLTSGLALGIEFFPVFITYLLYGPAMAIAVVSISSLIHQIRNKRPLLRTFFIPLQFIICIFALDLIVTGFNPAKGTEEFVNFLKLPILQRIDKFGQTLTLYGSIFYILGAVFYLAVNTGFVFGYHALKDGLESLQWRKIFSYDLANHIIMAAVALIMLFIAPRLGFLGEMLFLIPFVFLMWSIITLLNSIIGKEKSKISLQQKIISLVIIVLNTSLGLVTIFAMINLWTTIDNISDIMARNFHDDVKHFLKGKEASKPEGISDMVRIYWDLEDTQPTKRMINIQGYLLKIPTMPAVVYPAGLDTLNHRRSKPLNVPNSQGVIVYYFNEYKVFQRNMIALVIIFLLAFGGAGLILSSYIRNNVSKPLFQINNLVSEMSAGEGDLTQRFPVLSQDEIGRLAEDFNSFIENLSLMLARVFNISNELSAMAEELAASSEQMNASSEEIASSIQDISFGANNQSERVYDIINLSNSVRTYSEQVSNEAQQAGGASKDVASFAEMGRQSALKSLEHIRVMDQTSNEITKMVDDLVKKLSNVSRFTDIITDISKQTNLLALNASIEAARAGEHGRSFSIIADEVKDLSKNTTQYGEEIKTIINEVSSAAEETQRQVEKSAQRLQEGKDVMMSSIHFLRDISQKVESIALEIDNILKAANKQLTNMRSLSENINSIAGIVDETASSANQVSSAIEEQTSSMEELSTAAQNLADLAENLKNMTRKFKLSKEIEITKDIFSKLDQR
ncbi:MAG: methyl-accepting chemotaxis protein [Candidatus Coatesbacteria bacterium]|nr:methyl-accepting chemotaxis protein [Candidatus Coatesbacteria bacterium]